ncbi:hypothetical protein HSX11_25845 [Oxalobacteraceae bacterium]|nr:hypothetical protein [Oxalobacteraceae bacterium]
MEVAIVFLAMLGAEDAARYMAENGIPADVAARILDPQAGQRQGDYLKVSKGDPLPEVQAVPTNVPANVLALPTPQTTSAKHAPRPALQLVAVMGTQLPVHLPQLNSAAIGH